MNRRLRHSRTGSPDDQSYQGIDDTHLEGDPLVPPLDAIGALRPFGADLPETRLGRPEEPELPAVERDYRHAIELAESGRRLDAVLALRQLVTDHPALVEPRLALASLLSDDEPDLAIEQLTTALGLAKEPVPILVRRGALCAQLGRAKEAEGDFRGAIEQDPSHWPAYRYLGATRLRLGDPGEAVTLLREALSLAPQDGESTLLLGEALVTLGRLDEALGLLTRATELMPADPRGYKLLGRLLDRLGQTDEALAMHRKAREVTTA